ncbi:MvdC/MvdD family ATP grasp protein [Ornithinimicrobium cavernae]|uniref:MvdC/MvdD family ATP grasp protein n=1 Tax=Ornithinimicrobium cavernae TaxID=2666047 RepID=UPI000D69DA27|nr:alpha-L-glutamate ligase [Ornithinimicrobium cavernae]
MIVVISHPADLHAERVLAELRARGREVFLLDLADLPDRASLSIDPAGSGRVTLRHTGGSVDLTRATAVWWRRPQSVVLDAISDPGARGFAYGEWHEAVRGAYQFLTCPWMNPLHADEVASHKALQLAVAPRLGLRVPETLMTSDEAEAREFVARQEARGARAVYKIFAATHQVWRETRLVGPADLAHLASLHLAPVIFQEYVPAVADIRVTLVGDRVFAMSIAGGPEIDFRLGLGRARTAAFDLPEPVVSALQAMLRRFDLAYGAVDLRLTPEGELVFLEINPAGEFLFVEAGAGHPITAAVADWLCDPVPTSSRDPARELADA